MDLGSTTFQPYMFEPESDAENEDAPEVQHPRMLQEVSQWSVVITFYFSRSGSEVISEIK